MRVHLQHDYYYDFLIFLSLVLHLNYLLFNIIESFSFVVFFVVSNYVYLSYSVLLIYLF